MYNSNTNSSETELPLGLMKFAPKITPRIATSEAEFNEAVINNQRRRQGE
jgi:hypothetical protein